MKEYLLDKNKTLKEALKKLESNHEKYLVIIRSENILIGTLTDGDIRRAILKGANINSSISKYVKNNPIFFRS